MDVIQPNSIVNLLTALRLAAHQTRQPAAQLIGQRGQHVEGDVLQLRRIGVQVVRLGEPLRVGELAVQQIGGGAQLAQARVRVVARVLAVTVEQRIAALLGIMNGAIRACTNSRIGLSTPLSCSNQ